MGRPGANRTKPKDVIVKFTSYRARQKLHKKRTALKDSGYAGTFLNEDLDKLRSQVLFEARKVVKADRAKGVGLLTGKSSLGTMPTLCTD